MRLEIADLNLRRDDVLRLSVPEMHSDVTGVFAILGHNGAGKSLFLRMVHGILAPDSGQITWDGVAASQSRRRRGFMFQSPPRLRRSVADNVAFPLLAQGMSGKDAKARVADALAAHGLAELAAQPAATLSGGEAQRMALARALVTGPDVVLMDEPCANLDPAATRLVEDTIRRIVAGGVAVLISTHDLAQARRLATDVVLFDQGHVAFHGTADAFFADTGNRIAENFKAGYL